MKNKCKYLIATSVLLGSIASTPIAYANDTNNVTENELEVNVEDAKVIEDSNISQLKEEIINSDKYETVTTTETKKLKDGTTLEIENIEYKEKSNEYTRVSVGTNFGSFASIKYRDPLNYYKGTVNVNVQGKKTGANTAKINYIKYSNSGFKNGSRGAYSSKIVSTGNPARGMVSVHYGWSDFDASPQNTYTVIFVNVYPSTKITIG